jgi:hypothetical protein
MSLAGSQIKSSRSNQQLTISQSQVSLGPIGSALALGSITAVPAHIADATPPITAGPLEEKRKQLDDEH